MATEGAWIAACMRAAGVTEFVIPDNWIDDPREGSVLRYRDEMRLVTVFRLVEPADVIGAEVVDDMVYALPGGAA